MERKTIDVFQINIIDRDMESFSVIGNRGMMMVTKPDISPDFTIEYIHQIRKYHYELTKDMTLQERLDFLMRVQSCTEGDGRKKGPAFPKRTDRRKPIL